jgi:RNA polymerase sigma-70 factor, ECF subfamily
MSSDRELIERALAGDVSAFETLLERYRAPIRRHLLRYTHDDTAAQDLLQETFLRVWTRGEQWDGRGTFRAWLYRVATNLALNHLRAVRRRHETSLEVEGEAEMEDADLVPAWMIDDTTLGPQAALEQAEERQQIRRLVAALPDEKRAVFRLVHEMEMTIHDAAAQLEIPEGTVKSRLHYARKQLADDWQALDDTQEE